MTKLQDDSLDLEIGGSSVAENLDRALQSGQIEKTEDGFLQVAGEARSNVTWMYTGNGPAMDCGFLMGFLFKHAYAEGAVPQGCSACYKVKVVLGTLRQLVAAWEMAKTMACRSKWGTDLNNPYSQNIYAGYFYVAGLDAARTLFQQLREKIDKDPRFGPGIAMTIKRGCSEYEAKLGPSDRYEFKPGMAKLEAGLRPRFRGGKSDHQPALVAAHWIETAFRLGDDTYLDFTGGVRLREKTVAYPP